MSWTALFATVHPVVLTFATTSSSILLLLAVTWLFTTFRYHWTLHTGRSSAGKPSKPIKIPYTLPFLGHALSFLSKEPGSFWDGLFRWLPRSTGAFTLVLGGRNLHILHDHHAVESIFKSRDVNRDKVTIELLINGFGMDKIDVNKFCGVGYPLSRHEQERIHQEYMMKTSRVNELTATFMRDLKQQLALQLADSENSIEIGVYKWMRTPMFSASSTAFFGSTIVNDCPNLEEDFFAFDTNFLTCFFGVPRWLASNAYKIRENINSSFLHHLERTEERTKGNITDPDGDLAWEPHRGSRLNRARHKLYRDLNISLQAQAILDLGMFFGLSSNAIPASGWMLAHILNPKGDPTLKPRVMKEVKASQREDGSFDVALLTSQPLLQSLLHEVLRLYIDVLVTRQLHKDITVPVGPSGDKVLLESDSLVVMPSWVNHRGKTEWVNSEVFAADRWLVSDPETGKQVFSTRGSAGKFYPFGGGKSVCPGRSFAKQEILATVALVLAEFEMEGLGYLDDQNHDSDKFPVPSRAYPGPTMMNMAGDIKVRIWRRS